MTEDSPTPDSHSGPDRRKFLAAAVGVAALAGCTGDPESSGDETDANRSVGSPPARSVGQVDGEAWNYILDSIEYQNRALEHIIQELE